MRSDLLIVLQQLLILEMVAQTSNLKAIPVTSTWCEAGLSCGLF
jgi:hypothetical protein